MDPFLIQVLCGAFLQSFFSLLLTIVFGFVGSLGLISIKKKLKPRLFKLVCYLVLAPSFIPPIVLVVLGAKALNLLPTGLLGVVFFHGLMNSGLVSFLLYRIIHKKSALWLREALVANVQPWTFLLKGLLPELKADLKALAFYLFTLYFFSFSVPFLVGGSLYGGFEVFIYEKILFWGEWGEAIQYSLGLFVMLIMFSRFLGGGASDLLSTPLENPYLNYLSFRGSMVFTLLPAVILFLGLLKSLFVHWPEMGTVDFLQALRGTLLVGLLVGFIVFLILSLLAYSYLTEKMSRFLIAIIHPGWMIVGFSFVLLGGESVWAGFLKIAFALSILYLPYLFRVSFYQALKDLRSQVLIAQTFPVSWKKIFISIVWPQCLPTICLLSGLAALWACGDFAMTELLISHSGLTTIALEMKSLIASYRLEQAVSLLLPLLISSFAVFLIFQGLSYVSRRNTLS